MSPYHSHRGVAEADGTTFSDETVALRKSNDLIELKAEQQVAFIVATAIGRPRPRTRLSLAHAIKTHSLRMSLR